jgi:hypothetical protein
MWLMKRGDEKCFDNQVALKKGDEKCFSYPMFRTIGDRVLTTTY